MDSTFSSNETILVYSAIVLIAILGIYLYFSNPEKFTELSTPYDNFNNMTGSKIDHLPCSKSCCAPTPFEPSAFTPDVDMRFNNLNCMGHEKDAKSGDFAGAGCLCTSPTDIENIANRFGNYESENLHLKGMSEPQSNLLATFSS